MFAAAICYFLGVMVLLYMMVVRYVEVMDDVGGGLAWWGENEMREAGVGYVVVMTECFGLECVVVGCFAFESVVWRSCDEDCGYR